MFAHFNCCYVNMVSCVITLHIVSQLTKIWVLVRLRYYGRQQPKHLAAVWCQVYVLVCASCWVYKLKLFMNFNFSLDIEIFL